MLTFFGSLVGDTSISALNFAWLLLMFPVGIFGMSLATAVFPSLAEEAARGGTRAVQAMVSQTLRFTLFPGRPGFSRDAVASRVDRRHAARARRL